ncbi:ATP-binding protein [Nocardia ninae]
MTMIRSFAIEGLAGRRGTVEHELNDDVNIFWGPNGCGKTTMLRILHGALGNKIQGLRTVEFKAAHVEFSVRSGSREFTRSITKEVIDNYNPTAESFYDEELREVVHISRSENLWTTSPKTSRGALAGFRHTWLPITRIVDTAREKPRGVWQPGRSIDEPEDDFADAIEDRWKSWRFSANRQITQAQDQALTEVLEVAIRGVRKRDKTIKPPDAAQAYELVSNFFESRKGTSSRLFKSFDEFSEKYSEGTILPDIVRRLQEVEERIGEIVAPQIRLEDMILELYSKGRKVKFEGESISIDIGGRDVPLGRLSSGERQLMFVLLECLRTGQNSILVDEPELSMHVAWQNRLIECMRTVNPAAQIIAATHSPEIMANQEDRCVVEL